MRQGVPPHDRKQIDEIFEFDYVVLVDEQHNSIKLTLQNDEWLKRMKNLAQPLISVN